MTGPYGTAAAAYWQAGWRGILPLPAKAKKNPPAGYTGATGRDPSYPDIHAWATGREGDGNIALRLPRNVIGLDVDNYAGKNGAKTLHDAEARWGALPATWRTTSRDDGVSGIRLYRVPEGLAWPGELGPDTEIIQHGHRYAVVHPSLHPEGRRYRWLNASDVVSTTVPDPDELPALPDAWVQGLTQGLIAADVPRNAADSSATAAWLLTQPGAMDSPCRRMDKAIEQMPVDLLRGSAHVAARDGALRAVRLASEGHAGVVTALSTMQRQFTAEATSAARDAAGKARRSDKEAAKEWNDVVTSAVNLVTANPSDGPSCDCDGQLTQLIVGTAGANALAPAVSLVPVADVDPEADAVTDTIAVERTSWWPRNLEAVLAGVDDEPPPTHLARVDGRCLFYSGKVNGVIGESESGKTWIALLAVSQALRAGQPVMYLDFEDTAPGIVARLRALAVTDGELANLHYVGPDEALHLAASNDLREALDLVKPALIVLDGVNAAMTLLGLDLDNNKDATTFAQLLLKPLAATGACVIYVDHVPKNRDQRGKGGIGAQAKRAMTTGCVLAVEVLAPFGRGMTGRLSVTVDKDRAGHVRAVSEAAKVVGTAVLESDPTTLTVTVRIQAADDTDPVIKAEAAQTLLMEQLSDWLASDPDRTSKRAAREAVGARDELVRAAMDALIAGGWVQPDGPTGHRLVRRYSVADELSTW